MAQYLVEEHHWHSLPFEVNWQYWDQGSSTTPTAYALWNRDNFRSRMCEPRCAMLAFGVHLGDGEGGCWQEWLSKRWDERRVLKEG